MGRPQTLVALSAPAAVILLAACTSAASPPAPTGSGSIVLRGSGTVNVMYAGSLTSLFERKVGPAFQSATGFTFAGEGKGSVAIANLIKGKIRTPDVFVSADPAVDQSLQGPANGGFVSWWIPFARTEIVVAWSPRSRFAADFRAAKAGGRTWESVLEESGLRLGRTDPELDPKGYRTLWLFRLDEQRTGEAGETQRILGDPRNAVQIFPEEQLVARVQAGQLDAGIFYAIEAVEAGLPSLSLPASINQGDPAQAARYGTVTYTTAKGTTITGSPIIYTVTIPSTVRDRPGSEAFVQFLLSRDGQALLSADGLFATHAVVGGNPAAVPETVRPYLGK